MPSLWGGGRQGIKKVGIKPPTPQPVTAPEPVRIRLLLEWDMSPVHRFNF